MSLPFWRRYFWPLLFSLNLLLRVSTFYTPILDVDETQFAGFAHVLMDGGFPYRESLDTKPLGIYLFYWIVFELFGRGNMFAIHFLTALLWFADAVFLSKIFASFKREDVGRLAALLLIIFSTTFIPKYLATSINSVLVFFLILSVYFMGRAEMSGKRFYDGMAGMVLGLGLLFKYTAGIQWVMFVFWSLVPPSLCELRRASAGRWFKVREFVARNIVFGICFILPFCLHGLVLYRLGVWPDFVQWSLLGSGSYISHGVATISFWKSLVVRFGGYVLATVFLWLLAVRAFNKNVLKDKLNLLLAFWFVLSLVPVCMGGRFYPHYFLHLLPALCALAAVGFYQWWNCRTVAPSHYRTVTKSPSRTVVFLFLIPTLVFWILRLDHRTYLEYFPDDQIYEQQAVGERLKEISDPDDSLFVWGFATGIYFHSGLRPASRFLWTDVLTGRTPGPAYARTNLQGQSAFQNLLAWQAFWQDMRDKPPEYFLDSSASGIHDYGDFPVVRYKGLFSYLTENYEKIETFRGVEIYKRKVTGNE